MLELKFCQTIQTTIIFPIFHFIQPLANLHLWMYSPLGKYSPLNLFTSWQLYTFEFIHFLANIHLWIYSPLGRYTHLNLFTPWEIYTFATSIQDSPEHSKAFRKLFNYIDGQNSQGLKIPMTTPVTEKIFLSDSGSNFTMSFYIPSNLQNNPPLPKDSTVFIEERAANKAVHRIHFILINSAKKRIPTLPLKFPYLFFLNLLHSNKFHDFYTWIFVISGDPLFKKGHTWFRTVLKQ